MFKICKFIPFRRISIKIVLLILFSHFFLMATYPEIGSTNLLELKENLESATGDLRVHFQEIESIFDDHDLVNNLLATQMNWFQNIYDKVFDQSDNTISIKQKYPDLSVNLLAAIKQVSWVKNNIGYFCATSYTHCFAIFLSETDKTLPTVVINSLSWDQEKDNDTKTIGILHEGLSATLGNIEPNYQFSLLMWYSNFIRKNPTRLKDHASDLEKLINLNKRHVFVLQKLPPATYAEGSGGGSSGVGAGDLASIKLKKLLLVHSPQLWESASNLNKKCGSLLEFQNLIVHLRVEPSNEVINYSYWDEERDIIFTKVSSILDNETLMKETLNKISEELIMNRGCHVK